MICASVVVQNIQQNPPIILVRIHVKITIWIFLGAKSKVSNGSLCEYITSKEQ